MVTKGYNSLPKTSIWQVSIYNWLKQLKHMFLYKFLGMCGSTGREMWLSFTFQATYQEEMSKHELEPEWGGRKLAHMAEGAAFEVCL